MLLTQRAFAEGGRAMIYDVALRADHMLDSVTPEAQKKWDNDIGLFTPILKV